MLKDAFDFPRIAALLARPDFSLVFDGMNGVAGVYAHRVFVDELGAPGDSMLRLARKTGFSSRGGRRSGGVRTYGE